MTAAAHSRRASASPVPCRVRAVMIDLDGTLLDTIPDLAIAANMMRDALGRPPLDAELIRTFVGKGIPNLVRRALAGTLEGDVDTAEFDRALPVYERCYASVNGRHTTIYPGVMEGLEALRAAEFPLGCVTNKAMRFTRPLLQQTGLADYFTEVVAGDTLAKKKPDPEPLLYACERFRIAPREMLMIGDSLNDAQAARAAGCPVFCVTYGYNEGHDVRELDVDAIVDSLVEATRLIQKV
ncbi:MAG TPA: phosphoglycolate phosphatase [Burkholderiales bacterium]|nr:phosphoglycolate phosphatase [Burkholderiales bacterium]